MPGEQNRISLTLVMILLIGLPIGALTTSAQGVLIPHFYAHILPATQYVIYGPYISQLYITWQYTSVTAMFYSLLDGNVQLINGVPGAELTPSDIAALKQNPNVYVYDEPTYSFIFLQFNFKYYPENNTYFRWAFASMINPVEVEQEILEGGILGQPIMYYFNPAVYTPYDNPQTLAKITQIYLEHESYNLTRAAEYLKMAGLKYNPSLGEWTYPNGTPVTITIYLQEDFYNTPAWKSIIESAAQALNLTKNIQFVYYPPSELSSILIQQNYDIINFGWLDLVYLPIDYYFIFGPEAPYVSYNDFVNSTIDQLLTEAYTQAPTFSEVVNLTDQALVDLQYTEPYVIFGWTACIEPAYVNGYYGFTSSNGLGLGLFDAHQGLTTNGSLNYVIGTSSYSPPNFNIYFENFYSSEEIWAYFFPSPLTTLPSNPFKLVNYIANYTVTPLHNVTINGHYIANGTLITFYFVHNATWLNGIPVTALDYNFTIWYLDMGGFSSNPWNSSKDTVYIGNYWGKPVILNYTAIAQNPSPIWFGTIPNLVYTYVPPNNPYEIKIYINSTSYWDLLDADEIILPSFIFVNVNPLWMAPNAQGQYAYHITEHGAFLGGFPFYPWVLNESTGILLKTYNGYFQFNPLARLIKVTAGSTYTLKVNITEITAAPYEIVFSNGTVYYTTKTPIVPIDNATGYVAIMPYGSTKVIETVPLTHVSGSIYEAVINTSSLTPNKPYVIFVNATYKAPLVVNMSVISNGTGFKTITVTHYFYRWYSILPYKPVTVKPVVTTFTLPSEAPPVNVSKPTPPSVMTSPTTFSSMSTYVYGIIIATVVLAVVGMAFAVRLK